MPNEDDLESLQLDFSRLSSSIAAELRRLQSSGPSESSGPLQFTASAQPVGSAAAAADLRGAANLPTLPVGVGALPSAPAPPLPAGAIASEDDDEVPNFYAVRDQLHSCINSQAGCGPPRSVPLMQPAEENVIRIPSPARKTNATASHSFASIGKDFNPPRATLSPQQLKNAAGMGAVFEGMGRNSQRTVRAVESASMMADVPENHAGPRVAVHAVASHAAAGPNVSTATHSTNSIMLSARRPGAPGGPTVLAAMSPRGAVTACRGNAPTSYVCSGAVRAVEPPIGHSGADDFMRIPRSAPTGCGACDDTAMPSQDSSGEVLFGHLAMKAALDSHRAHYEAARSRMPSKAASRKTIPVSRPALSPAASGDTNK